MFKKTTKNNKIRKIDISELESDKQVTNEKNELKSQNNSDIKDSPKKKPELLIKKIKKRKGILIKPVIILPPKKQEEIALEDEENNPNKEDGIKKIFVPEAKIKSKVNKFLGQKRENEEKIKEQNREGLNKMQKEIYSLPENLKIENLLKQKDNNTLLVTSSGVFNVPVKGQQQNLMNQMKIEEIKEGSNVKTEVFKINYDTVLDNFKDDFCKVDKNLSQITQNFGNVFVNQAGRKMKFIREREKMENKLNEQL